MATQNRGSVIADQHDAVAEVNAIDHHHRQIEPVDAPRQPLAEQRFS